MREYSKYEQRELRHIISDDIGLCGCGSDAPWKIVMEFLERAKRNDRVCNLYADVSLMEGYEEFIAKTLDTWKLLEHGSNVSASWLTAKGETLLAFLQDVGDEELPDFTHSCAADEEW